MPAVLVTRGLGDVVASVLAENIPLLVAKIGVRDEFSQLGIITPDGKVELKIHSSLTAEDMAATTKEVIKKIIPPAHTTQSS